MKKHQKTTGAAAVSSPVATDFNRAVGDEQGSKSARHQARAGAGPKRDANARAMPADAAIAARAYSFWEARGFEAGSPEEDWYRAIEDLTGEKNWRIARVAVSFYVDKTGFVGGPTL
jgi:hypothetical protein